MTLDEAQMILNLKNASEAEKEALLKVIWHDIVHYKCWITHDRTMSIYFLQMHLPHQKARQGEEVEAFTFNLRLFELEKE